MSCLQNHSGSSDLHRGSQDRQAPGPKEKPETHTGVEESQPLGGTAWPSRSWGGEKAGGLGPRDVDLSHLRHVCSLRQGKAVRAALTCGCFKNCRNHRCNVCVNRCFHLPPGSGVKENTGRYVDPGSRGPLRCPREHLREAGPAKVRPRWGPKAGPVSE